MITINGINIKTMAELLEAYKAEYKKINPDWDISPQSLDGQQIAYNAYVLGQLNELVIAAYQACDLDSATGTALTSAAKFHGKGRRQPTAGTVVLRFTGQDGAVIPQGTLIGDIWETTEQAIIPSQGFIDAQAQCQELGDIPAPSNTITSMSPISGVDSVTNPTAAQSGEDVETDTALRMRIKRGLAGNAVGSRDTMYAAIADLSEVTHLRVDENINADWRNPVTGDSMPDKAAGAIAPNSLLVMVKGGDINEIAQLIIDTKSPGCNLNGEATFANKTTLDKTTSIVDKELANGQIVQAGGSKCPVTLFRPVDIPVHVKVTLRETNGLPSDYEDQIKDEIRRYSLATLFSGDEFDQTGFEMGESITQSDFQVPIQHVIKSGARIVSIKIGKSSADSDELAIAYNELAVIDTSLIEIEVLQ